MFSLTCLITEQIDLYRQSFLKTAPWRERNVFCKMWKMLSKHACLLGWSEYQKCTGKSFSEALIFASTNPKYDKLRKCCVQKLFFAFYLIFRTIYVHNMFWAWNFHLLNLWFNDQSFVILWVSWNKNKCFWKRFTCTNYIVWQGNQTHHL